VCMCVCVRVSLRSAVFSFFFFADELKALRFAVASLLSLEGNNNSNKHKSINRNALRLQRGNVVRGRDQNFYARTLLKRKTKSTKNDDSVCCDALSCFGASFWAPAIQTYSRTPRKSTRRRITPAKTGREGEGRKTW
jgi:hypothetical protein